MSGSIPARGERSEVQVSHSDIIEAIFENNSHLLPKSVSAEEIEIPSAGSKHWVLNGARYIPLVNRFISPVDERKILIESLLVQQKTATTYRKWYDVSLKLDEILGNNLWKLNPESPSYDYDSIYHNLTEMRDARLSKDYKLLLYLIRTKWIRNLGNMGNLDLYRHSHVGTKKLIEEYVNECQLSLDYLIYDRDVNLDDRYLLGMLIQTRKNVGRTALVLSGGSTFGVFHIGVLITLLESNLLPRIVSGSSAGSIIASILCCHTNEETVLLLNTITERKFNIFGGNVDDSAKKFNFKSLLNCLSHLLKYGTLFDIDGLQETMIDFVGDLTFREAYNRTGKILNITVSPASMHEQTRLLNYLTAPNCLIWSAVCASCSLPGIFSSTSIYEKNPRTNEIHEWNNDVTMKYVDGSVDNDLPITRLSEMFNVDHIIAVQVNPHVLPVLKVSVSSVGGEIESELNKKVRDLMNNCYDFVTCEIVHYLQILSEMNVYQNLCSKLITLLSQSYSGDVTILPDLTAIDFLKIFENPSPEFILDFIIRGARASWPKVTVIRNHCGVEFALDKAISLLRGRLITSANNRITGGGQTNSSKNKSTPMDNTNSSNSTYYTLVNSPVLNDHDSSRSIDSITAGPPTKAAPKIKRHNSVSSALPKVSPKPKRNSISTQNVDVKGERKRTRGQSTTSLFSLSGVESSGTNVGLHARFESDHPQLYANHPESAHKTPVRSEESTQGFLSRTQDTRLEHQKNIRKAKSSSNFHKEPIPDSTSRKSSKLKYQSERIPYYKGNPYLESVSRSRKHSFDYDHEVSEKSSSINSSGEPDKPNLPKRSNNNSLKNSYIGLNRLKDQPPKSSASSSAATSRDSSTRNSYYNLKEHPDLLKSLNSPDIRRSLTRHLTREKSLSASRFNTDDGDTSTDHISESHAPEESGNDPEADDQSTSSTKRGESVELIDDTTSVESTSETDLCASPFSNDIAVEESDTKPSKTTSHEVIGVNMSEKSQIIADDFPKRYSDTDIEAKISLLNTGNAEDDDIYDNDDDFYECG